MPTGQPRRLNLVPSIDNRMAFVLLRWLVTILAGSLMVLTTGQDRSLVAAAALILALAASNIILTALSGERFVRVLSGHSLIVLDAVLLSGSMFVMRDAGLPVHLPLIGVAVLALVFRDTRFVFVSLVMIPLALTLFHWTGRSSAGDPLQAERFSGLVLLFLVTVFYSFLTGRFSRDRAADSHIPEDTRASEIMVDTTRALSSAMSPEEIYRTIVTRLSDAVDNAECRVVGCPDGELAVLEASDPTSLRQTGDVRTDVAVVRAYQEKRTVRVGRSEGRYSLAIPMVSRDEVFGLIQIRGCGRQGEPSGSVIRSFEVVADTAANVLRNVRMFEEMKHMARTDFLTGMPNHRHFQTVLTREVRRANRNDHPLSLLVIDLDFLKRVNDHFGHLAGDRTIRLVARSILETCRDIDFAARYGGEEFVVILPETDLAGALLAAERIRSNIAATRVDNVGRITASIGVSNYPLNATNRDDLLRVADQALYVAKDRGRNQIAHFEYQLTTV